MLRIAVPDLVSNSYFPIIAAVEMGFFQQEGFDASVDLLFPIPKTFEALRDGALDFVVGSAHATLLAFPGVARREITRRLRPAYLLVSRYSERSESPARRLERCQRTAHRRCAGRQPEPATAPGRSRHRPGQKWCANYADPGRCRSQCLLRLSAAKALEEGKLDGFWANGMGCEVALRSGVGKMVLDVRRGDGPPAARHYTFSALIATDKRIHEEPDSARAAIRALMKAHRALKEDANRATAVAEKRFPPAEAKLIAELVRRDLPYYDPTIPEDKVMSMNRFAQEIGLLSQPVPYDRVVATEFSHLWKEPV